MNAPRSSPVAGNPVAERPEGPVLGFDYGTERIGVAVGQTLTGTASPLTTLDAHGRNPDWTAIDRLVEEWRRQRQRDDRTCQPLPAPVARPTSPAHVRCR
jgi:hypothetical protein